MGNERRCLAYYLDRYQNNPYQKLLYSAISQSGIKCLGYNERDLNCKWLFKNRKDIKHIHLHWPCDIYSPERSGVNFTKALMIYFKLLLAKALDYKILWTIHNYKLSETTNFSFEKWIMMLVSCTAHIVITHSHFTENIIKKRCKSLNDKIKVIPNGSYIGYYPNNTTRQEARKKLGIVNDCFTFLSFGMMSDYKQVKLLIGCFKDVEKANPDIRLIIAGNPSNEALKNEIEEMTFDHNISCFLKNIPDSEVQYFFNASDIVVLPNQNIFATDIAILALSFDKFIIAPDIGSFPELIPEGKGFLFKTESGLRDAMYFSMKKLYTSGISIKDLKTVESLNLNEIVSKWYLPLLAASPRT